MGPGSPLPSKSAPAAGTAVAGSAKRSMRDPPEVHVWSTRGDYREADIGTVAEGLRALGTWSCLADPAFPMQDQPDKSWYLGPSLLYILYTIEFSCEHLAESFTIS
jgi:hypothetical protein